MSVLLKSESLKHNAAPDMPGKSSHTSCHLHPRLHQWCPPVFLCSSDFIFLKKALNVWMTPWLFVAHPQLGSWEGRGEVEEEWKVGVRPSAVDWHGVGCVREQEEVSYPEVRHKDTHWGVSSHARIGQSQSSFLRQAWMWTPGTTNRFCDVTEWKNSTVNLKMYHATLKQNPKVKHVCIFVFLWSCSSHHMSLTLSLNDSRGAKAKTCGRIYCVDQNYPVKLGFSRPTSYKLTQTIASF